MNLFSISQLSKYAGIKPHTIRIWEKRYNALQPSRSEGNTRYYDDEQLRRLLNIVSLKDEVTSLSDLCGLTNDELNDKVGNHLLTANGRGDETEFFISQLISSVIAFDERLFNKVFNIILDRFSMETAYTDIYYPLLVRVGIMWSADRASAPAEHFLSNLLKQKFYALINEQPLPKEKGECWLLFLREGEFHELGLLFANFILRNAGRQVIYLGANTPLQPLLKSIDVIEPTHLLFFQVETTTEEELQDYIQHLSNTYRSLDIFVATSLHPLNEDEHVHYLHSLQSLKNLLKN